MALISGESLKSRHTPKWTSEFSSMCLKEWKVKIHYVIIKKKLCGQETPQIDSSQWNNTSIERKQCLKMDEWCAVWYL